MYLKQIVTSGFKSFADKLDIKLDDSITCIVGPNGSGKSNVVDAVRWVLGEQSVKSLRGDGSMSDVIFSGSKSRNPLNVASVELIFDNTDHYINVPYTIISIKRRVYRSGENEYFINNEKCRLKDITNMLLDTGMGKESFNIISQGEVNRILSSSAADRRIIFEEASGVLKYKKRKEEALRKLDRTHQNLDRVTDIISELEMQVNPLKEQKEKAEEYLENKQGLDKYEVALLAYDIENLNNKLEESRIKKEKLDNEIITLSNELTSNDSKSVETSLNIDKLNNKLNELKNKLLSVTQEVEKINGEKNLLKEKTKSTKEEEKVKEEIRTILEEKSKVEKNLDIFNSELKLLENELHNHEDNTNKIEGKLQTLKTKKQLLVNDYSKHDQDILSVKNKISSLKQEIELGGDIPNSVRQIIRSNSLTGIYDTIGNILSIDEEYTKALNIAINSCKNFIITKDEDSAKKAINYLKDNRLGRATFFPLTVIKERYVDNETINILKNSNDYLGILSDLVVYNQKYDNIVKNQLGTVVVARDLDSATHLSHMINAKYRIVSLDGDVINVGGSLSGGSYYNSKSIITTKQELAHLEQREKLLNDEKVEIQNEIVELNNEIGKVEEELFINSKEKISVKEKIDNKKRDINDLNQNLSNLNTEWKSLDTISNNNISEKEQELIKLFHEKNGEKEKLELEIKETNKELDILKIKQDEDQASYKLKNQNLRNIEKESNELEVEIGKTDVKLDNMLEILSTDYELTYEKAKSDYQLDIEPDEARKKVNKYRANIKRIGMVNLDAIEEYDRVNTRYEFLSKQREDLLNAQETLLDIMNEMDEVMKEEFKDTFDKIQVEFKKVFKELFRGGTSDLKLTDPDDLLTTGVEIVASPPGKKLTTISLLSGGEKTLTAISLLFAILNVRPTPFCLFDEVEAALDEANVVRFGNYLDNYRDKTQFLIITHKKKTMEYANTLYGITMQESGVSKLVSVKLEDHDDLI